jgi:hypothetical protein
VNAIHLEVDRGNEPRWSSIGARDTRTTPDS